MLRPLDALDVDALLHHLPQRAHLPQLLDVRDGALDGNVDLLAGEGGRQVLLWGDSEGLGGCVREVVSELAAAGCRRCVAGGAASAAAGACRAGGRERERGRPAARGAPPPPS